MMKEKGKENSIFQAEHLPGHLSHRNPERRESCLPWGIRATRTGSASKHPGVGRDDWLLDEPISGQGCAGVEKGQDYRAD